MTTDYFGTGPGHELFESSQVIREVNDEYERKKAEVLVNNDWETFPIVDIIEAFPTPQPSEASPALNYRLHVNHYRDDAPPTSEVGPTDEKRAVTRVTRPLYERYEPHLLQVVE